MIIITFSYCLMCRILEAYARFFPTSLTLLESLKGMQDFTRPPLLWFPAETHQKRPPFLSSVSFTQSYDKTSFNFYLHFIFELQDYIIEKQITYNFSTFRFEQCIKVGTNRSIATKMIQFEYACAQKRKIVSQQNQKLFRQFFPFSLKKIEKRCNSKRNQHFSFD